MHADSQSRALRRFAAAALIGAFAHAAAFAGPVKIEGVLVPKADTRLDFADGSKRFLLAVQREGKVDGTGPLAGATMLEWGLHEVNPATGANANGYLVFTASNGDLAYAKYTLRAIPVPTGDGKIRFLANGQWEAAGGTGTLKSLRGGGTLQMEMPSPKERRWILQGDLVAADQKQD